MANLVAGRIAHAVPSRVRIKVERNDLTETLATRVRSALVDMPGVSDVRIQPITGSITVYAAFSNLDRSDLARRLHEEGVIDLNPTVGDPYDDLSLPLSETARGIKQTFRGVDARLGELTNGRWDLRTVVPFALGALALRAFIADSAALGAAPWYVLAWYAFDSFWKLNQGAAAVEPGHVETDHDETDA